MRVLILVGLIFCFEPNALGQKLSLYTLDTNRIHSPQTGKTYLFNKSDIDQLTKVYRVLDDQWVIGQRDASIQSTDAFEINALWKLSPSVLSELSIGIRSEATFELTFDGLPTSLPPNARILPNTQTVQITSTWSNLEKSWLDHPDLIWVEHHRQAREESILRRHDLSVNDVYLTHHLYGNHFGVTSSIKEQRFRLEDIDLVGLGDTTTFSHTSISSHATDMATLVSGQGISFLYGTGVSSGRLISTSYDLLFPEPSSYFSTYQCAVQNHSYGVNVENYYGAEAQAYDQISFNHPEILHVFSSGNSGTFTAIGGNYHSLLATSNLTGTFKQAKNVLVVGATDSLDHVKTYSSRGPSYDGRIKPEIVAYGGEGSSDAAAVVSGIASYLAGFAQDRMSQSLTGQEIKALLIAGAKDIHTPGPDYISGYGQASLYQSIEILNNQQFFTHSLTGDTNNYDIQVPEGTATLKIVLYWHDAPSLLDAPISLMDDLDLTLITPDQQLIYPWILSTAAHRDSLNAPAKRGIDKLNNTEVVTLTSPMSGTYQIQISGKEQSYGIPFTIAYQLIEHNQFVWKYPTPSDHLIAEQPSIVRWKSTLPETNGQLLMRYMDGSSMTLDESVNLANGALGFTPPDTTAQVQLVMKANNGEYVSDTLWIEKIPEVKVFVNCEDKIVLQWDYQPLAENYELFNPDSSLLPPNFTDTIFTITRDRLVSGMVALRALYENKKGIRSYAINFNQQGVGCYITNFLVRQTDFNGIQLEILLNGLASIDRLDIYKTFANQTRLIHTIDQPKLSNNWFDTDLEPGIQAYQIIAYLIDGTAIESYTRTVYYTDEQTQIVFPNPVSPSDFLSLLSKASGGTFQLIRADGGVALEWPIVNNIENIPLYGVRQGFYVYRILLNEEIIKSGKLMVK